MSDRPNRRTREPWGPDIAGVLVCLVIAGMLRLSAVGFLLLCMVVAAFHGWFGGRNERRSGRRREATNLPRRQRVGHPRELAMPRPAPAPPRRVRPRPRYVPDDLDDLDDDWGDDGWDFGDSDFDDDEPCRRPGRDRHHRAESWETDDADYI